MARMEAMQQPVLPELAELAAPQEMAALHPAMVVQAENPVMVILEQARMAVREEMIRQGVAMAAAMRAAVAVAVYG